MRALKRLARPIGLVLGIVATIAFGWYAVRALQAEDLSAFVTVRGFAAILTAALFYSTIIPSTAVAWSVLTRDVGESRSLRTLTEIIAVSQFAKYIPGNVGVHLGRAGMALARGMNARNVFSCLVVEGVLAVAAALFVGTIGLCMSGVANESLADTRLQSGIKVAALVVLAIGAAALAARLAPRALRERLVIVRGWPSARAMLKAFGFYAINYMAIAIGMWGMATLLFPERPHNLGALGAAFALAWVAGFFAPGAPAGLGIRETLMLLLLSLTYESSQALVLVVAIRIATILADAAIFIGGNAAIWLHDRAPRV